MKPLSEYKIQSVVVVDFTIVMDAVRNVPGAFSMFDIEDALTDYRSRGFLIAGVHNRPQVGRMEETEQRYVAEVDFTLKKFKANPFHVVKACYYDSANGQGPFCRRSLLELPNIGMLVMIEAEAWGAGISTDWGPESFVVGLSPMIQEFASRAGLRFVTATEVFL